MLPTHLWGNTVSIKDPVHKPRTIMKPVWCERTCNEMYFIFEASYLMWHHFLVLFTPFLILISFLTFWIFLCVPAETEPHEGKRKVESLWPIFRLHHQRSRYIYDLFYKRKAISRGRQGLNVSPFPLCSSLSTFYIILPCNSAWHIQYLWELW